MQLYDPRADIVFRKIFGTHKNICISFLNALLPLEEDEKIVSIEYQYPDTIPDIPDKDNCELIALCTDATGKTFLVEMQMFCTVDFLKRTLFNASKACVSQSKLSMVYNRSLRPVYCLCLLNLEEYMPNLGEYCDEYTDCLYININHPSHTEIHIGGMLFVFVELTKFKSTNLVHNRLAELWLRFLTFVDTAKDDTIPAEIFTDPDVRSAVKCLENMHLTEKERLAYDKYWDTISSLRTLLVGREAVGEARSKAIGEREKAFKIASKMLAKVMDIADIVKLTELTREEVIAIKSEIITI